jgi:selenide,water dikinase
MKTLTVSYDSNVITGFDGGEDAGVYRISPDLALVQTLDFMTPIADDPYIFGQIAAANSLSDIYAMGGRPITAMNIVCFPVNKFSLDILAAILKGGQSIIEKSGAQLLGGHSIDDPELKYGLSVTGTIHPDKVLRNTGAKPGDLLILTKPLGTGIIGTAVKAGLATPEITSPFLESMITLNNSATLLSQYPVSACTDVTGFGIAGHIKEMLSSNGIAVNLYASKLPILPGVREFADMGIIPAGLYRNKDYASHIRTLNESVPQYLDDMMFDPQTSGGLLIAVSYKDADSLLRDIKMLGFTQAAIIGEFFKNDLPRIILLP